jgi:flagellin
MPVSLVSNNSSVAAQFNLQNATNKVQASIQRLSSGNAITKAGDNVAALAVGTQFRAFVNILKAGFKNAAQATSMLGVADGALQAIGEILQRQSTLASQSKSGSLDTNARTYLDQEFQGLVEEIDRIATNTNFNSIKMLDGSMDTALSSVETKTETNNSESVLKIKFGENTVKSFDLAATALSTTNTSKVVTVTMANHGLQSGDVIDLYLNAAVNNIDDETDISITVVDKDTFTYTTANAAANATSTGGAASDAFKLQADPSKCYDLLDGNTLSINGVTFTAKNTNTDALTYTGAAGQIKTNSAQTPAQLATEVKAAIDYYIDQKATGYEKLLGVEIQINPSDSSEIIFTHRSNGVSGNNFYIQNAAGAQITGGTVKQLDPSTLVSQGGTAGDLTQMNTVIYGTLNDDILDTIAGARATASFTIATNPSATTDGSAVNIAIGNIKVNADGTGLIVTQNGHGLKGGEIAASGGIALDVNSGMTAAAGDYTVTVLNEDTYLLTSPVLTGTFTGHQALNTAIETLTFVTEDEGDRINVNGKEFKYVTTTTGADDEILIGADIAATRINTIEALNKSEDPRVLQATYAASSTAGEITATYKGYGTSATNRFTLGGAARSANLTITNRTLTGGTAVSGIDSSKITNNTSFIGKISGFNSTYKSNNTVDLSVTVGSYTYTAENVNTSPTSATWITLSNNDGGGSFKLEMAAGKGSNVTNQSDADSLARRFDNAFSGLKAVQRRELASFTEGSTIKNGSSTIGSLQNAAIYFTNEKFTSLKIEELSFVAPDADSGQTDARVEMVINGETYRTAAGIGSTIYKGSILTLTNEDDSNKKVEFRIGNQNLDLSTDANAAIIEEKYKEALDTEAGADAGVNFQIGTETSDNINVKIKSALTTDIYLDDNGEYQELNIKTPEAATVALEVLSNAITTVTSARAQVGVYQSRFDYASAAINSSIQNQDAARSEFLDTKVEEESSDLAMSQVRMNASISVLAQANQITQGLLQLLRG